MSGKKRKNPENGTKQKNPENGKKQKRKPALGKTPPSKGYGRLAGERSKKTGLEPGTPVLVGGRGVGDVHVMTCRYNPEIIKTDASQELPRDAAPPDMIEWVHVNGLHNMGLLAQAGDKYDIHPLVLEDIVNTEQRAKIEEYGSLLFIVVKMVRLLPGSRTPEFEQISLLLTGQTVLTFQDSGEDLFRNVRSRLQIDTSGLRSKGVDFLVYALLDEASDNCFDVLEHIGLRIEEMEDDQLLNDSRVQLHDIKEIRGQLLRLRRVIWPMRDVTGALAHGEYPLMGQETLLFLRDVQDHIIVAVETIDAYRELLNGLHDLHLAAAGYRMNAIMKVLAIISTIFMPLSFIAGVYGMNFDHMPELRWRWGYFIALGLMAVVAFIMLLILRKKKWM